MFKLAKNCPICNSWDIHSFQEDSYLKQVTIRNDVNHEYQMYYCDECGTHFLFPSPKEEQIEKYYDGMFRKEVHTSSYYDKEYLHQAFQRFTPEALIRVERIEKDLKETDTLFAVLTKA